MRRKAKGWSWPSGKQIYNVKSRTNCVLLVRFSTYKLSTTVNSKAMAFSSSRATRRPGGKSPSEYLAPQKQRFRVEPPTRWSCEKLGKHGKTTARMLFKSQGWLTFGFGFRPHSWIRPHLRNLQFHLSIESPRIKMNQESTTLHQNDVPWPQRWGNFILMCCPRGTSSLHCWCIAWVENVSDSTWWPASWPQAVATYIFVISCKLPWIQTQSRFWWILYLLDVMS